MKTIFEVGNEDDAGGTLLIETGQDYFCYAVFDQKRKSFRYIRYLSFDHFTESNQLSDHLSQLQKKKFDAVRICFANPEALLVPNKFSSGAVSLVDAVYDSSYDQKLSEAVPEWQLSVSWSVPARLYQLLLNTFPSAVFSHVYVPALKIYNGFAAPNQVNVHFTIADFRVLVKKDGQIMLMQTFRYKTPLDVVYLLLKIVQEFGLVQEDFLTVVSGLIDRDSALFSELHQYFMNIEFAHPALYEMPETELPLYYFNSLYNLAACVS